MSKEKYLVSINEASCRLNLGLLVELPQRNEIITETVDSLCHYLHFILMCGPTVNI